MIWRWTSDGIHYTKYCAHEIRDDFKNIRTLQQLKQNIPMLEKQWRVPNGFCFDINGSGVFFRGNKCVNVYNIGTNNIVEYNIYWALTPNGRVIIANYKVTNDGIIVKGHPGSSNQVCVAKSLPEFLSRVLTTREHETDASGIS